MVLELISETARNIVPFGLVIALILLVRLGIKAKSVRSLQAELSIFLTVWVVAELLRSLFVLGVIGATPDLQFFGLLIHTASMTAFGVFLMVRYYSVSRRIK